MNNQNCLSDIILLDLNQFLGNTVGETTNNVETWIKRARKTNHHIHYIIDVESIDSWNFILLEIANLLLNSDTNVKQLKRG